MTAPPIAPADPAAAADPAAPARRRRVRRWLLIGIALLYAAIYKGPGGYVDQFEYMEMSEQLWLHGNWAAPQDSISAPRGPRAPADGPPPPRYHHYPVGLALISAPLVYLGAGLEGLTAGLVSARAVLCLLIPLLALGGAALWFEIAADPRCGLGAPLPVAAGSTLLFALGSSLWNLQRLYYAEVAVTTLLIAAVYSWLRAGPVTGGAAAPERRWLWATGAALTAAAAGHYADLPLIAGLGLPLLIVLAAAETTPPAMRAANLGALLAVPLLGAGLLLTLNTARFGAALNFGYGSHVTAQDWQWAHIGANVKNLCFFLVRTAWLPAAMLATAWLWIRRRGAPAADSAAPLPPANAQRHALLLGLCLAFGLQLFFWLGFRHFGLYPLRYGLPMIALAAPGLTVLLTILARRRPRAGLPLFLAVGLLWSLAFLLYFDCHYQGVLVQAGDCGLRPFDCDAATGRLEFFTWYMQAPPAGTPAPGQPLMFVGTPPGSAQWLILSALALLGGAALARGLRLARAATPA